MKKLLKIEETKRKVKLKWSEIEKAQNGRSVDGLRPYLRADSKCVWRPQATTVHTHRKMG